MERMKTIYVVSYWVPFPHSEYGGVQVVIAENDAQCVRILADADNELYKEDFPNYAELIAHCVREAKKFPLDGSVQQEGIVHQFLT
jgi:hypothetical protein